MKFLLSRRRRLNTFLQPRIISLPRSLMIQLLKMWSLSNLPSSGFLFSFRVLCRARAWRFHSRLQWSMNVERSRHLRRLLAWLFARKDLSSTGQAFPLVNSGRDASEARINSLLDRSMWLLRVHASIIISTASTSLASPDWMINSRRFSVTRTQTTELKFRAMRRMKNVSLMILMLRLLFQSEA